MIEQHDELAAAAGRGGDDGFLAEERTRERCDDHQDRRAPHQQERPVADPPAAHGLIRDPLHEHERRKLDDAFPLPLDEVHEYRDGYGRAGEQEQGSQEGHGIGIALPTQRTRIILSRDDR